jgi:hypothetical protein
MGDIGDPADKVVGGVTGRSVEFPALVQGTDLVNYTATLVQTEAGRAYLVTLSVPVTVVDQQEETINQALDSVQFQAE